jgi:hypothetical protein
MTSAAKLLGASLLILTLGACDDFFPTRTMTRGHDYDQGCIAGRLWARDHPQGGWPSTIGRVEDPDNKDASPEQRARREADFRQGFIDCVFETRERLRERRGAREGTETDR